MIDIKSGDVVTLKSGGEKMTVDWVGKLSPESSEIYANLEWMDETGHMQRNRVPVELLKISPTTQQEQK